MFRNICTQQAWQPKMWTAWGLCRTEASGGFLVADPWSKIIPDKGSKGGVSKGGESKEEGDTGKTELRLNTACGYVCLGISGKQAAPPRFLPGFREVKSRTRSVNKALRCQATPKRHFTSITSFSFRWEWFASFCIPTVQLWPKKQHQRITKKHTFHQNNNFYVQTRDFYK